MGVIITMPRYGANMDEGTLASWAVTEGDAVSAGQVLCEIEIEKLSNELEAPEAGVIRKILCLEGETLPCGAPIAVLAEAEEDIRLLLAGVSGSDKIEIENGQEDTESSPEETEQNQSASVTAASEKAGNESVFPGEVLGMRITPKALKLAGEMGFDYRGIKGTGILGAITREDIRTAAEETVPGKVMVNASMTAAKAPSSDTSAGARMNTIRKITAQKMMESLNSSAQTTIMMDADLTEMVGLYSRNKAIYASEGVKLSYTAIILKVVSEALVNHPIIRTIVEREEYIRTLSNIDIGIAVDADYGLIVPVIRNVDRKDLSTVCRDLAEAAARAKAGTLSPEEVRGGAFTISNVGMLNVKYFTPILNTSQSAILGIGCLTQQPVIIDNGLHIRWIISLSLTYDHRIVDGAPAAKFLNEVRSKLESPAPVAIGMRI